MTERLIEWLTELSRRERMLLAALALVALPAGAVFGVAAPLAEARSEARRALDEAAAVQVWLAERAAVYRARSAALSRDGAEGGAPIGISGIERSLVAAGLRRDVSALANRSGGGVELSFDAVRFTVVAQWLSELRRDGGYRLAGFRFERGEAPDVVAAELVLEPAR